MFQLLFCFDVEGFFHRVVALLPVTVVLSTGYGGSAPMHL